MHIRTINLLVPETTGTDPAGRAMLGQKDRWLQSDTRSDISPLVMADGRQTAGAGIRKDPAGIGPAQVAPEARACSITCCSASPTGGFHDLN